jgi:hypothetical protein
MLRKNNNSEQWKKALLVAYIQMQNLAFLM